MFAGGRSWQTVSTSRGPLMTTNYDGIAREYQASKLQPWRTHVERHTLLQLTGDVRGARTIDLACGEGSRTMPTRWPPRCRPRNSSTTSSMSPSISERRWIRCGGRRTRPCRPGTTIGSRDAAALALQQVESAADYARRTSLATTMGDDFRAGSTPALQADPAKHCASTHAHR